MQRKSTADSITLVQSFLTKIEKEPDSIISFGNDALKAQVRSSAVVIANILIEAGTAGPVDDDNRANAEYAFLMDLPGSHLSNIAGMYWSHLEIGLNSILYHIFNVTVPGRSLGGYDIVRIAKVILKRRHELGIDEDDDEFVIVEAKIEEMKKFKKHGISNSSSPPPSSLATRGAVSDNRESRNVPKASYLDDGSRISRSIQSTFQTINKDDSSKFSGNLECLPSDHQNLLEENIWDKIPPEIPSSDSDPINIEEPVSESKDPKKNDVQPKALPYRQIYPSWTGPCGRQAKKVIFRKDIPESVKCAAREVSSRKSSRLKRRRLPKRRSLRQTVFKASDLSISALKSAHQDSRISALIDTGASRSVVGLKTAKNIAQAAGDSLLLTPSYRTYKFGVDPGRRLYFKTSCIKVKIEVR